MNETVQTSVNEATAVELPAKYLAGGYYSTAENGTKYLNPAYVLTFAQDIAASLAPMKPSDFAGMLREIEMLPKAISLVRRKKAPQILIDFIKANLEAIHSDVDWTGFYRHLELILGFLYVVQG